MILELREDLVAVVAWQRQQNGVCTLDLGVDRVIGVWLVHQATLEIQGCALTHTSSV